MFVGEPAAERSAGRNDGPVLLEFSEKIWCERGMAVGERFSDCVGRSFPVWKDGHSLWPKAKKGLRSTTRASTITSFNY